MKREGKVARGTMKFKGEFSEPIETMHIHLCIYFFVFVFYFFLKINIILITLKSSNNNSNSGSNKNKSKQTTTTTKNSNNKKSDNTTYFSEGFLTSSLPVSISKICLLSTIHLSYEMMLFIMTISL